MFELREQHLDLMIGPHANLIPQTSSHQAQMLLRSNRMLQNGPQKRQKHATPTQVKHPIF